MTPDEIRSQFKSQNLDTLKPSGILQVGGPVFPDQPAIIDLNAFKSVVQSWQGVHAPAYGQPIPTTGATVSVSGAETVVSATGNQVKRVEYILLANGGGSDALTGTVTIGTSPPISLHSLPDGAQVPPNSTIKIDGPFFVDVNLPISVDVSAGTVSDLTTSALVTNIVQ
jgi:hypothetical protein